MSKEGIGRKGMGLGGRRIADRSCLIPRYIRRGSKASACRQKCALSGAKLERKDRSSAVGVKNVLFEMYIGRGQNPSP
jgi:hypothetical protein